MLEEKKKKKLLHLIPYLDVIPPKGGGALRCYNLSKELGKHFKVTVLTFQDASSIKDKAFEDISVINAQNKVNTKGWFNKIKNALKCRWYLKTYKGPAEITVLEFYPVLKQLSKVNSFDYILMEHLSTIDLGGVIKHLFPKAIRIADQHNVDHLLYQQNHDIEKPQHLKTYKRIKSQEKQLYKNADLVLACSELDLGTLKKINNYKIEGFVLPNGTHFDLVDIDNKNMSKPNILFCGSLNYEPNKNGLLWFFDNVFPAVIKKLPNIKLTIIGRSDNSDDYAPLKSHPNIDFVGEVESVLPYYTESSIAIVPLFQGSGTRLKVLESMCLGCTVISTSVGAEGIDYRNGIDISIKNDASSFAEEILSLLSDSAKSKDIARNAQQLIQKHYKWDVLVSKLHDNLKELKL